MPGVSAAIAAVDHHQLHALGRQALQAGHQVAGVLGDDVDDILGQRRRLARAAVAVAVLVPDEAGADQRDSQETTRSRGMAMAWTSWTAWTSSDAAVQIATR